jgi:adenylate cyclase
MLNVAWLSLGEANAARSSWRKQALALSSRKDVTRGSKMGGTSFDEDGLHAETTTLMFADVVESVRLIEQDEFANVRRVRALLATIADTCIAGDSGRLLERRGDGLLVRFADARNAVACAAQCHEAAQAASVDYARSSQLQLRIGIHTADLYVDESAVYGQGVNLASRVASLANAGETVVSAASRDQLTAALDGHLIDLGECYLKHVAETMRVYRVQHVTTHVSALSRSQDPPQPKLPIDSHLVLAILPVDFAGRRGLHVDEADILLDQWTQLLSTSPGVRVISRLSANAFRGRHCVHGLAPTALGAHYTVRSQITSYSAHSSDWRIVVQILRGTQIEPVWEESFPLQAAAVVDHQSPEVLGVASKILSFISHTERLVADGRSLPNLSAHTLYLVAVSYLHRFSRKDFERARLMLEALAERAPRHAAPCAWLARWHVFNIVQGWTTDARSDSIRALSFAKRALDHDPRSSLALAMAGSVEAGVNRDMHAAKSLYEQSLIHNPSEPLAWLLKGVAEGFMGEARTAVQSSERALQLSPLDPLRFYYDSLSSASAMSARQFDRAIELAERAISANCMHGSAYRTLAIAQVMRGQSDAALETVRRLLGVEPHSTVAQFRARAAVKNAQNEEFAGALLAAGLPSG